MAERTVTIKIVGDASKAKSAFSDVGSSAGTLEAKVEGLGGKWANFGTIVGGVVTGAVATKALGFFKDGAQGAADDEASMGRLQQAVANTGASWDAYSPKMEGAIKNSQALGFQDGETSDALALLTSLTGDGDEALRRLATAQDLARGTGMDLHTAAQLLGKVNEENIGVLGRYGISVEKGATAQDLLNKVDAKFGGQAGKFAESDAGKWARTANEMGEVQESIGGLLIPAFTILSGVLLGITQVIQTVVNWLGPYFVPVIIGLAAALATALIPTIIALATTLFTTTIPAIAATVVAMAPILAIALAVGLAVAALYLAWQSNFLNIQGITQTVLGYLGTAFDVVLNIFNAILPVALGALQAVFGVVWTAISTIVTTEIGVIQTIIETVWPVIQTVIETAIAVIQTVIETALSAITAIWETVWPAAQAIVEAVWPVIQTVVETTMSAVQSTIETIMGAISAVWDTIWGAIQSVAETIWDAIEGIVETAIGVVQSTVETVLGAISGTWDTIWGAIQTTADTIWGAIKSIVETAIGVVQSTIETVMGAISDVWDTLWGAISDAVDTAWNAGLGIVGIVSTGIGAVKGAIERAYDGITGAWQTIWDTITGAVGTAKDVVVGIVGEILDAANGVIRKINGFISNVNSALEFSFTVGGYDMPGPIPDIPSVTLNVDAPDIPSIPELASGGIATRRTLAFVGEAGPEAIIPLDRLGSQLGASVDVNYYGPVTIVARDQRDAERGTRDVAFAIAAALRARGVA